MRVKYNITNNNSNTYICFNPNKSTNLDSVKEILEGNDTIHLYPNNEDENPDTYKNITKYIYTIIHKREFLCKGLNPEYILSAFNRANAVVIIGSSSNILPNGNIFGFALIHFKDKSNSIKIDIICSHVGITSAGSILLNKIEYMSQLLFYDKIYLESVKSAISFYEKYGFTKTDNLCDDMCIMTKTIKPKSQTASIKTRTKSIKSKTASIKTRTKSIKSKTASIKTRTKSIKSKTVSNRH